MKFLYVNMCQISSGTTEINNETLEEYLKKFLRELPKTDISKGIPRGIHEQIAV